MPNTRNGAALLEAAREFRPRILAERDEIETSRRLPAGVTRGPGPRRIFSHLRAVGLWRA